MTALTKDRNTPRKAGEYAAYPVAAGAVIYGGSLVCRNAAGYAVPAADTAGLRFLGVARQHVDNSGGANGAAWVEVWQEGVFRFAAAGMAITDVGLPVFAVDDQTVGKASTNAVGVGIINEVESATAVWISISRPERRTAGAQANVAAADGQPAAGTSPTKAEFDAVVTLANETKAVLNGLLAKLRAAGMIAE